jgi:hypothetical protein
MTRIAVAGIGIVSVLLVSACGSASTRTAGASTSTTTRPTGQNIAADTAAAQAASLRLSDFPSSWTSGAQSGDTGPQSVGGQLAKCLGVSEADLTRAPALADSPSFSDPNDDSAASSTVGYRATAAAQQAMFAVYASPKVPGCVSTVFSALLQDSIKHPTSANSTLPEGVTLGKTSVAPMSLPTFGDRSTAYQVKIPITYKGLDLAAYVDLVVSIKGRASVAMTFEGNGNPFPTDEEQHYTSLVVSRLTDT